MSETCVGDRPSGWRRLAVTAVLLAVVLASVVGVVAGSEDGVARAAPGTDPAAGADGGSPNGTTLLYAGDALTLDAGPGQAVRGRTDLRPGTVVTVRVQATDGGAYLRSATATVGADGRFRAVFDVSELQPGTPLEVVVHREGENLTVARGEVVACSFCPASPPMTPSAVVDHEGSRLSLEAAPGQVVTARTNLQPGAEVNVQLRSSGGASPFIKTSPVVVDENGTARAVFDLDDVPQGTDVQVRVAHNGSALTTAQARVACSGGCEDTATPAPGDVFDGAEVGVVQAANGSVARVRLQLGDADVALLTVRSPATSYAVDATVRDGDGDGTVVVLFDTRAAAGAGTPLSAADAADTVQVREERGRFGATDYRLALHPPENASAEVATGLLVVTQNGTAGTPLLTATPGRNGALPLGSAAALVVGAGLAVLGMGLVLGLVDPRALVDRL